jgi:hypothetical protein
MFVAKLVGLSLSHFTAGLDSLEKGSAFYHRASLVNTPSGPPPVSVPITPLGAMPSLRSFLLDRPLRQYLHDNCVEARLAADLVLCGRYARRLRLSDSLPHPHYPTDSNRVSGNVRTIQDTARANMTRQYRISRPAFVNAGT